eukprot:82755-Amphidinium_carterae.1
MKNLQTCTKLTYNFVANSDCFVSRWQCFRSAFLAADVSPRAGRRKSPVTQQGETGFFGDGKEPDSSAALPWKVERTLGPSKYNECNSCSCDDSGITQNFIESDLYLA